VSLSWERFSSLTKARISSSNISGKCDLKCSYNYDYSSSNSTATNKGVLIELSYENSTSPPVLYNNEKYSVIIVYITCPSIHLFNGSVAAGEIIIEHTPVSGGKLLNVAIPIISSTDTSYASNIITEIIQSVSTNAPAEGDSTTLNIPNFTLQNIVPNKPFYTYTTDNSNWIVYGSILGIPLSSATLTTLGEIIKVFPLPTPGNALFVNSSGPNMTTTVNDEIYISCNPTGSSEETTGVTYTKNSQNLNLSSLMNNSIVKILFGCIFFIVILLILNKIYTLISTVKKPT